MDSLFADFSSLAAMSKEKAEKNMQEALNYLGLDLRNIAKTMRPYHPLEMLKMAAWEERRVAKTKGSDRFQQLYAHLLPVLVQSVLQSTLYDTSYPASTNRDIKQKDWNRLLSLAEDSVKRLLKYIESYAVFAVRSGAVSEENAERYRTVLLTQFFPPAENHDSIEKYSCLWYGYAFDDEKTIREKFGTDLKTLLAGLEKIAAYGLDGIDKLTEDFSIYKAEMLLLMARKKAERDDPSLSDDDIRDEVVHENNWEMRVRDLQGRRDDFDLFRPEFAADLPSDVYQTLSRPIGSLDIEEYLRKGLWPATVFPFVRFGSMYFSFVQSHILTYGQRILALNAGLYLRDSAAAAAACRLLFSETDMIGVYSFDGNKVDISILSSVTEVNAVENPSFFDSRVKQHEEDKHVKPQDGHKLLLLDPDSDAPLEKLGNGMFSSSVYYLIRSANSAAGREEFHRTIFGSLEFPEKTEILDYLDEDDIDDREAVIDDIDDDISDEYEYDDTDDDEKAKAIEEKEKEIEESYLPSYHSVTRKEEEIRALQAKYELTDELIQKDEKNDAEADEYEKELDDDDYSFEEGDVLPPEDDEEIEDEELYDEVEKEDLYQKESPYDSDQADLFDDLYDTPDEETEAELETEEEVQEEEKEYEEKEEEATDFALAYTKEQENRAEPSSCADTEEPVLIGHSGTEEESSSSDGYIPTEIDEAPSADDLVNPDRDGQASDTDAVSVEAIAETENSIEDEDIPFDEETAETAVCAEPDGIDGTDSSEPEEADENLRATADRYIPTEIDEAPSADELVDSDQDTDVSEEVVVEGDEDICSGEESAEAASDTEPDSNVHTEESTSDAYPETEEESSSSDGYVPTEIDASPAAEDIEQTAGLSDAVTVEDDSSPECKDLYSLGAETYSGPDVIDEAESSRKSEEDATSGHVDEAIANEDAGIEEVEDGSTSETEEDVPMSGADDTEQKENVSDMVDRGVVKRVDDGAAGSVFVMVGNGDGGAADDFSDLDGIIKDIAEKVGPKSTFVDFVRSSGQDMHSYLEGLINKSWSRQKEDGKDKMFSIFDYSLSILIAAPKVVMDDIRREEILNNAGAVMYSRHASSWNALVLSFGDDFTLLSAEERKITPSSFSPSNWKICRIVGEQLIARGK